MCSDAFVRLDAPRTPDRMEHPPIRTHQSSVLVDPCLVNFLPWQYTKDILAGLAQAVGWELRDGLIFAVVPLAVVTPFGISKYVASFFNGVPFWCTGQWIIASFFGSQIATGRATISSLVLTSFPSGLAGLVPGTRYHGYVQWQRHTTYRCWQCSYFPTLVPE